MSGKLARAGQTGAKSVFLNCQNEPCSVEEFALEHYKALGWEGLHSENGLFATLFGLLFWDVLFMPVPDVFQTAFQGSFPWSLSLEVVAECFV